MALFKVLKIWTVWMLWGLIPVWAQEPPVVSPSTFTIAISSYMTVSSNPTVNISTEVWRTVPNTAFHREEDFFYLVRWGLITGGYSTLSVRGIDVVGSRPAYHLVSDAHSSGLVDTFYKVHDRNDVWLDLESLTTVRYEKHVREGHYRIEETVTLDQIRHRFHIHSYRIDKDRYEDKDGDLPPSVLDVLGSLYYVRTLPMVLGESYSMDVFSGEKVWPLLVSVKKREHVKVPAGKFDCFRVEPLLREAGIFVSKGKKLEVWLTADERRMPVQMRSEIFIGHVSAELVSYHILPISSPAP